MKYYLKLFILFSSINLGVVPPGYSETNVIYEDDIILIPNGKILNTEEFNPKIFKVAPNQTRSNTDPGIYKYGKSEYYNKEGEMGNWELNYMTFYDYNERGDLIKTWDEGQSWSNGYSLYFYDEKNRNNKIDHYWEGNSGELELQAYHVIEYLQDFPDLESSIIYYTKDYDYDWTKDSWVYSWKIYSGEKKDYTLSKKVSNYYEKKVDYIYNTDSKEWDISGYKYDYVINSKGQITETLVYQATNEIEEKWPLILHVKNLINDNGVIFRSERINYQNLTPYIERWSDIQWENHNGEIPISGYAVQGANRMKSAKIEYLLVSDPNVEYSSPRHFSSDYQNDNSFHYIVMDNDGNILIDNSYYRDSNSSLQEIYQGNNYQMQYYDIDNHNWVTYDHYLQKQFYENNNVITQRDYHRFTYNEYYLDSDETTLSEHYEYDALTNTEPYKRSRTIHSEFKKFSAAINEIKYDYPTNKIIYYNLQGKEVKYPQKGQFLIRKIGNKTDKIIY